eukprot:7513862-Ditylum_brightwellii.AAC.1
MAVFSLRVQSFIGCTAILGLAVTVPTIACGQDRKYFEFVQLGLFFLLLVTKGFSNILVSNDV